MKAITVIILIINIFIHQKASAACAVYITDEWPVSRYTVETISGDNVVTDDKTGLMWKQCSEGLTGADCMAGIANVYTWKAALDIPADLNNNSGFAGYNDWRVPNQKELRTIIARNCVSPIINEAVFPNTPSIWFWSSSPVASFAGGAWIVDFDKGADGGGSRDGESRLRLVRSGF